MFKHSADIKSWATLCVWPVCLNFGSAKVGASWVRRHYHVPVRTVMLWSPCFQSSRWSWSVVHIIYDFREIAVTLSSHYRCFYLLSRGKMLDTILGKGGAVKSFMLIYKQCLLSAHPFQCPVPLLARTSSKITTDVSCPDFSPSRLVLQGMFKTVIPAFFNQCKGDWRENWDRRLSYHCNQEMMPKHSVSVDKCCF